MEVGIRKIIINGAGGFMDYWEKYEDKVTITENSISYVYTPWEESESNQPLKWKYKTDSEAFRQKFQDICILAQETIDDEEEYYSSEVNRVRFVLTYEDKTKRERIFWMVSDFFSNLFGQIKEMIPGTEETPMVLRTGKECWNGEDEELVLPKSIKQVDSSVIKAIGYSAADGMLYIEFTDKEKYMYMRVPKSVYKEFMNAEMKDAFYFDRIKGRYEFGRVVSH